MNRQQRRATERAQSKADESNFRKMMNMDEHTKQLLASGKIITPPDAVYAVPPAVVEQEGPDGVVRKYAYPQAAVAMIADKSIAEIAVVVAIQAKKMIFEELERRGIIPPLDLGPALLDEKAGEGVHSEETGVPTPEEES